MVSSAKAKGGKEIPVPKVTAVPTYNTDYLPTFREQSTYIRGRGRSSTDHSRSSCMRGGLGGLSVMELRRMLMEFFHPPDELST